MDSHDALVRRIAASVRAYYDRKEPFRISHGSTNSTRRSTKGAALIDTSALNRVLDIDVARKTALVEPNVPMDRLVAATLKHGLVPPVVMEFPGITAGGGFAGTSGESSSFRHGFFDRTLNFAEMVLADGRVVRASETEHADLFRGAAGAVGTLGVTTLVEVRLLDAKKYVRVTYHPVAGMDEAVEVVKQVTSHPDAEYVDGIMFSKERGVILVGTMTDEAQPGEKVQRFSRARDEWYYLHVQSRLKSHPHGTALLATDLLPLAEYLFRYDRGGFWVGASAFGYFAFPFVRAARWLADDFVRTRMLYRALHASRQAAHFVVQDLALPLDTVAAFASYADEAFDIYPLWLCPLRQGGLPTFHPHVDSRGADDELIPMLNVGLWGWGARSAEEFEKRNRELETRLRALGGMKWFYAQCYYSEEEFWRIYDRKWYDGLRRKYNAEYLPSVWDKVHVDVERERALKRSWKIRILRVWSLAGIWGLWEALKSWDWWGRVRVERLEVGKRKIE